MNLKQICCDSDFPSWPGPCLFLPLLTAGSEVWWPALDSQMLNCTDLHLLTYQSLQTTVHKHTPLWREASVTKLEKCWAWAEVCTLLTAFPPWRQTWGLFAWEILSVISYWEKCGKHEIKFVSNAVNIWDTLRTGGELPLLPQLILHINTDLAIHEWFQDLKLCAPMSVCFYVCVYASVPKAVFFFFAKCSLLWISESDWVDIDICPFQLIKLRTEDNVDSRGLHSLLNIWGHVTET